MKVNKYRPFVCIIPEGDANVKLINGFLQHGSANLLSIEVRTPAGGWKRVLEVFLEEYLPKFVESPNIHVVMIIDFDEADTRRTLFEHSIPSAIRSRVFLIGSWDEPESLKRMFRKSLEEIGNQLSHACLADDLNVWEHPHLIHNLDELKRMMPVIKPIVFKRV